VKGQAVQEFRPSDKALRLLHAAGWSSDRRIAIDATLRTLADRGYVKFSLVEAFLSSFYGIDVSSHQGGFNCQPQIVSNVFPVKRLAKIHAVLSENVFPLGTTSLSSLFMGESGKVHLVDDDLYSYRVLPSSGDMLEYLIGDRTRLINLPERLLLCL
jgi:hypothetical protein